MQALLRFALPLELLALLTIYPSFALAQTDPVSRTSDGSITITYAGQEHLLSADEIRALPRKEIELKDKTGGVSLVSGVSLWDVLQKVKIPPAEASGRQRGAMYLCLTGADGQSAALALAEIDPGFSKNLALLIDQRDRQPLDPVEGTWRVILPEDIRHARWIRGLVKIRIATIEP